jgi:hypothetical protein
MANTVSTPERATEWLATYIKEKKHTPGKRSLAKQYREEFFIEYSAGEMAPEKKALITGILGPNFFAPVDKFESECRLRPIPPPRQSDGSSQLCTHRSGEVREDNSKAPLAAGFPGRS